MNKKSKNTNNKQNKNKKSKKGLKIALAIAIPILALGAGAGILAYCLTNKTKSENKLHFICDKQIKITRQDPIVLNKPCSFSFSISQDDGHLNVLDRVHSEIEIVNKEDPTKNIRESLIDFVSLDLASMPKEEEDQEKHTINYSITLNEKVITSSDIIVTLHCTYGFPIKCNASVGADFVKFDAPKYFYFTDTTSAVTFPFSITNNDYEVKMDESTVKFEETQTVGTTFTAANITISEGKITIPITKDANCIELDIIVKTATPEINLNKCVKLDCIGSPTLTLKQTCIISGSPTRTDVPNLLYSSDEGQTWTQLDAYDKPIQLSSGTVYLRGDNNNGWNHGNSLQTGLCTILLDDPNGGSDDTVNISGSIMGLMNNGLKNVDLPLQTLAFAKLFGGSKAITKVDNGFFPNVAEVNAFCYSSIFQGCTNLVTAPDVVVYPDQIVNDRSFQGAFSGCSKLTMMPELQTDNLRMGCYSSMFEECSSLKEAKDLPAITLMEDCYNSMFRRCTNLIKAPSLGTVQYLNEGCCNNMFRWCSSLKQSPQFGDLSKTKLYEDCFSGMFDGCSSLVSAPSFGQVSDFDEYACYQMFMNCSNLKIRKISVDESEPENVIFKYDDNLKLDANAIYEMIKSSGKDFGDDTPTKGYWYYWVS